MDTPIRDEATWTIAYVRRMMAAGRITNAEAYQFLCEWNRGVPANDQMTVDELAAGERREAN